VSKAEENQLAENQAWDRSVATAEERLLNKVGDASLTNSLGPEEDRIAEAKI
jgi:hypothetical protein